MKVGELKNLIPPKVHIMALTATARPKTRDDVYRILGFHKPVLVYVPPTKSNIIYFVKPKVEKEDLVCELSREMLKLQDRFPKTIIFCRRFEECSDFYLMFIKTLGDSFTSPAGLDKNLSKFRVVDMYTSCTKTNVKANILKSFCCIGSHLRIVIATIAFSMGLDIPDLRQVIHWGPSDDLENYIQETGRAGRDGKLCCAVLYHARKDYRYVTEQMVNYCTSVSCKRQLLFADFEDCDMYTSVSCKCYCCSVCNTQCQCSKISISSEFSTVFYN